MAKTSKAQIKAKNNYQARNPNLSFYWQKKSSAKGYINPRPSTKLYKLVQTDKQIKDTYISDLQEFKNQIENTIKELHGKV